MDTTKLAQQLADTAIQAGMDQAARILADWLDKIGEAGYVQYYYDGADDALCTLIEAGATDPRLS